MTNLVIAMLAYVHSQSLWDLVSTIYFAETGEEELKLLQNKKLKHQIGLNLAFYGLGIIIESVNLGLLYQA